MAKMKLRLDLDHLSVDSFATQAAQGGAHGTVRGNMLEDTSTFDLGKHTNWCTVACPNGTLACEPDDPNEQYRLPQVENY